MSVSLIEVVDTAVKIGLGSIITALIGYIMLRESHKLELEKNEDNYQFELRRNETEQSLKFREQKRQIYIDFLTQSQVLRQRHLYKSCNFQDDDYLSYLRTYNELQISSSDEMRLAAHNLFSAVKDFISLKKFHIGTDMEKLVCERLNDNLGLFQKLVQQELGLYETSQTLESGNTNNND